MTSSDIDKVAVMWLPRMSVPTRDQGVKICSSVFSVGKLFFGKVRVPMSKRMYKRGEATLMYYLAK